ncbi:MAG: hypothetical protein ACJ754_01665 [Pyrinomonadaceae bacterium]
MSKTVEQIIGETVNNVFNCETVALVDPKLKLVPSSPKFISTDDSSWQKIIELLLKRALVVFLVLPPEKGITKSVLWEVERIVGWGLVGRFVIVLPPPNHPEYKKSQESAKELAGLFPKIHGLPDQVILVFHYSYEQPQFWEAKPKKREIIGEFTYVAGLKNILTHIKSEMSDCPLPLRYQYSWRGDGTASIRMQTQPRRSDLKPVDDNEDDWPETI